MSSSSNADRGKIAISGFKDRLKDRQTPQPDFSMMQMPKDFTGNEPLLRAARAFQDAIRTRNLKKQDGERNGALEREFAELQAQMDSKMNDLQDLSKLADKNKPAAHVLEMVMGEMEQRNIELTSLLKASEKSRTEMEEILRSQNNELTTLRANTVIMKTLEEEVKSLTVKRSQAQDEILKLEAELAEHKKIEQSFHARVEQFEHDKEAREQVHAAQLTDLTSRLRSAEETISEKDDDLVKADNALKELFGKCSQLSSSNDDIKAELAQSLESGKRLLDVNSKLHFCKTYLEQQVDQLVKELKFCRGNCEQLKLELANMSREKTSAEKQLKLARQNEVHSEAERKSLRETVLSMEKQLEGYETGAIKSAVVLAEMSKTKEDHSTAKQILEKRTRVLDDQIKQQSDEMKKQSVFIRKLKSDIGQMQSKLDFYQQNFIEKAELQKIKTDLEIKYKLDVNTQLQKISSMFEKEQSELIAAMQQSLHYRRDADIDFDVSSRQSASTRLQ